MTPCHVQYHRRALAQLEERYGINASNVLRDRGHPRRFVDTTSGTANRGAYYEDLLLGLRARFGAEADRSRSATDRQQPLEQQVRLLQAACDYAYAAVGAAPALDDNATAPSLWSTSPAVVPVRDVLVEDEWRVCDAKDAALAELADVTHSLRARAHP
jgi:hypothetical protein